MRFPTYARMLLAVLVVVAAGVVFYTHRPDADTAFAQPTTTAVAVRPLGIADTDPDPYDRNAMLWANRRSGYTAGWQRGREIYYMRCWMCHSEYVIAGDHLPTPSLRDVAKRMTDLQITLFIRAGNQRMPAYSPEELPEEDLKDLLALFREKCGTFPSGGGCFDEHNPPPNPNYRFHPDTTTTQ